MRKREEISKRQEEAARRQRKMEERRKSIEDAKQKRIASRRSLFAWTKKENGKPAHKEESISAKDLNDSLGVLVVGDSDIELVMSHEDLNDDCDLVSENKDTGDSNKEDHGHVENRVFPSIGIVVGSASSQNSPAFEYELSASMEEPGYLGHLEAEDSHRHLDTGKTKFDEDPEIGVLSYETDDRSAHKNSESKQAKETLPQCLTSRSEYSTR